MVGLIKIDRLTLMQVWKRKYEITVNSNNIQLKEK